MNVKFDRVAGFGIGVSDLAGSAAFYQEALGMHQARTYDLPQMDEIVMAFEGKSAAIILMHFKDGSTQNYKDNPVKLVFYVTDAAAIIERIRTRGLEIIREPSPYPDGSQVILAFAKDPDGYIIELIQMPIGEPDAARKSESN